MKKKSYVIIFLITLFSFSKQIFSKINSQRKKNPVIHVSWHDDSKTYQLSNTHLREWPLFNVYDEAFFNAHRLPNGRISFRNNPDISVESTILDNLLEELILEIQNGNNKFKHFTLIHDRTFNKKLTAGSLVLKFNDYPFIAKIFMENPYSFVNPFKKGWVQYFFFLIGGGVNRHIAGFTRIKNLEHVRNRIAQNSEWSAFVDTPRKWFWTPQQNRQLKIVGCNLGWQNPQKILMPATYCILTDAIEAENEKIDQHNDASKTIMDLCCYLDFCIDFNIDNFIIEHGTQKMVIIDTEHYPTLVGITHKPGCSQTYASLVFFVIRNSIRNIFFNAQSQSGMPFDIN